MEYDAVPPGTLLGEDHPTGGVAFDVNSASFFGSGELPVRRMGNPHQKPYGFRRNRKEETAESTAFKIGVRTDDGR